MNISKTQELTCISSSLYNDLVKIKAELHIKVYAGNSF